MKRKYSTILVTGAAGFIGSHLCTSLVEKGYKVIGVDDLSKGSEKNLSAVLKDTNFDFKKIDIVKRKNLLSRIEHADVIVHLAAAKIPRYGNRVETLRVNSLATENVLELARKLKSKFIFASTSDVYGKMANLPFKENSDLKFGAPEVARWAYAVSKLYDEHLIFGYSEQYGLDFVILRFFGIFGPNQHRSWSGGPQSLFIDAILSGEPIEIHGNGEQKRTFLYVEDAVDAIIKAIGSEKAVGQVINIGSEQETTILALAKEISRIAGKSFRFKKIAYKSFTGKKYEDILRKRPDINKAKSLLNWKPSTDMREGLGKTILWYIRNPK